MIFDRFQGDPGIELTQDGASMTFKGGQPVMDQGLNNAVLISLFTSPGWWGNDLADETEQIIGSDFSEQRTIIEIETINDIEDAARLALEWIVGDVDINVTNPVGNQIKTDIIISPPGQDINELLFTQNGLTWIGQAFNPVSERL